MQKKTAVYGRHLEKPRIVWRDGEKVSVPRCITARISEYTGMIPNSSMVKSTLPRPDKKKPHDHVRK